MKRKLWIILALMAILWCGAAMADTEHSFTAQPASTASFDRTFTISWATDFVPVRVEISKFSSGEIEDAAVITEGLRASMSWPIPMCHEGDDVTYYVFAYYGERISDYVISNGFKNDWEHVGFTTQPACTLVSGAFKLSWTTSFVPIRIRVRTGYYDTFLEQTDGLAASMSRIVPIDKPNSITYYVDAWYGEANSDYVTSDEFYFDRDLLCFISQPQGGQVALNGGISLSWITSFTPTRVEIGYRVSEYGEFFPHAEIESGLSPFMQYDLSYDEVGFWSFVNDDHLCVRAYYSSFFYADSEILTLTKNTLNYMPITPIGRSIGPDETLTLSWSTSFTPIRTEIGWKDADRQWHMTEQIDTGEAQFIAYPLGYDKTIDGEMFVRSFYNNVSFVESSFQVRKEPRRFSVSPLGGSVSPDHSILLSWYTNFTPVRIVIGGYPTGSGTFSGVLSESANLRDTMSRSVPYDQVPVFDRWEVHAYYDAEHFVPSRDFTVIKLPPTFQVTFDANDGEGRTVTKDVEQNTMYTLPESCFTWGNNEFYGWELGSAILLPGDTVEITEDTTFRASWLMVDTVSFDAGGGTGSMDPILVYAGEGAACELPECDFTYEGREFKEWRIGTQRYQPGDIVNISGDTTVYAEWLSYFTVTFNANGGTGTMQPVTLLEGSQYTLPENSFTSATHNFSYWAVSAYPNSRFYPGRTVTVNSNIRVTAVWVVKEWCTLTFDMQGRGTQVAPITVEKGTVATEPTKPTSDLRFAYWEYNENSTAGLEHWVPFDFSQPVTRSRELRAHWVSNAMRRVWLSYSREAGTVELTATGKDGMMVPVGERVHINITTNPHFSIGWIYVDTLQTHSQAFDMPNKDNVYVRVTFERDHEHSTNTLQVCNPYTAPGCTAEGRRQCWYCPICDHYYSSTFDWLPDGPTDEALAIPAFGHDWGAPTYTWADDKRTVTAARMCANDPSHVETETVNVTAVVSLEPTPDTRGVHTYTAEFQNPAFSAQTLVLDDMAPCLPVTAQYFPDGNFRAYVSMQFDTDSDGYLSGSERLYRNQIYCNNKDIASFEGIAYFPKLTWLYANNNLNLTALDLSGNPQLITVQANNCALNQVILTGCTSLKTLQLSGNPLAQIDLTELSALNSLNVVNCAGLHTLDISRNVGLQTLNAYGSGIITLDIRNNPYMIAAYVLPNTGTDEYDYYGNSDYTMKVNKGAEIVTAECIPVDEARFPDEFFRLWVSDNADKNVSGWLTQGEIDAIGEIYLNVPAFAGLTSAQGIEYFPDITELIISDTPELTSLDLSGNTRIESLELIDTGLTSLTLGDQPEMYSLLCYGNNLTVLDITGCPHLVKAYHSLPDTSRPEYDSYTSGNNALYVSKGVRIGAGDPEPTFTLPAGLTRIEDEAFAGTRAQAVLIPVGVTEIEGNPFQGSQIRYIYGTTETAENFAASHGYIFVPGGE